MSQIFEWAGTLQPGERLTIDAEHRRVRKIANAREKMSGEFITIQPGTQTVAFEADGLEELAVALWWRDRWQ